MDTLRHVMRSAVLWTAFFSVSLFLFLIFGARPALHLLGLLLGALGGPGLEGTPL